MRGFVIAIFLFTTTSFAIAQSSDAAKTNDLSATKSQIQTHYYDLTSAEELKKAIDYVATTVPDPDTREKTTDYVIKAWQNSRMIADAIYAENLHKALDAWYANDRDWRKIPNDVWSKLTERDRGRIREQIDPELAISTRRTTVIR